MASELYNTIDALSREKGIDPQIVVSAVEDAIVVATRKYYKTQENLRAELDKETGKISAFAVKTIVEEPGAGGRSILQVTLDDARKIDPNAEIGGELQHPEGDRRNSRTHCRAACQASDLPEGARSRARHGLQRVHRPRGRNCERHREAHRRPGCDLRHRQSRSAHAAQGAVAAGVLRHRRARARGDCARGEGLEGAAGGGFARGSGTGAASVPDRSAGNLRRHGSHPRHCARSRRAHQDRRHVARTKTWMPSARAWA